MTSDARKGLPGMLIGSYALVILISGCLYFTFSDYQMVGFGDDLIEFNGRQYDDDFSRALSKQLFQNGRFTSNVLFVLMALCVRLLGLTPFDFPWLATRILSMSLLMLSAVNLVGGWATRIQLRDQFVSWFLAILVVVGYVCHVQTFTALFYYTAYLAVFTLPLFLASSLFLIVSSWQKRRPPKSLLFAGVAVYLFVSPANEQMMTLLPVLFGWALLQGPLTCSERWSRVLWGTFAAVIAFMLSAAVYFGVPSQQDRNALAGVGLDNIDIYRWLHLSHRPLRELFGGEFSVELFTFFSLVLGAGLLVQCVVNYVRLRDEQRTSRIALAEYWALGFYLCFLASCAHLIGSGYQPPDATVVPSLFWVLSCVSVLYAVSVRVMASPRIPRFAAMIGKPLGIAVVGGLGLATAPATLIYMSGDIARAHERAITLAELVQRAATASGSSSFYVTWCPPYWDSVGGIESFLSWVALERPVEFHADGAWIPEGWMTGKSLSGSSALQFAVALPRFSAPQPPNTALVSFRSYYHVEEGAQGTHGVLVSDYPLYRDWKQCHVDVRFNPHPEVSPDLKAQTIGALGLSERDGRLNLAWNVDSQSSNATGILFDFVLVNALGLAVDPLVSDLPNSKGSRLIETLERLPAFLRLRIQGFTADRGTLHGINFTTMMKAQILCGP